MAIWGGATALAGQVPTSQADRFNPSRLELSAESAGGAVELRWTLAGDAGTAGFDVFRRSAMGGKAQKANGHFLADTLPHGGEYVFADAPAGGRHAYWIETTFADGSRHRSDEVEVVCETTGTQDPASGKRALFSAREKRKPKMPGPDEGEAIRLAADRRAQNVGNRAKIVVENEGLYRLDAEELAAKYGATAEEVREWIGTECLRLSSRGVQCGWLPDAGNGGLYFYNPGYEDEYTRQNVFWLERESPGIVVPPLDAPIPAAAHGSCTYEREYGFEQQARHEYTRFYGAEPAPADYWLWFIMQAGSAATNVAFSLDRLAPDAETARFDVWLQGGSNSGASNEHCVALSVNGTEIGRATWSRNAPYAGSFEVPVSVLSNGVNTMAAQAILAPGVAYSTTFFDRFSVVAAAKAEAYGDYLRMPRAETEEVRVSGFSGPDVRVVEILGASRIRYLDGVRIDEETGGNYSASFVGATNGNLGYVATRAAGALVPARIEGVGPDSLRSGTNRADYVVLTHGALESEARRLADFRAEGQPGLEVRTILVEDAYNAFSHGFETPAAIRRLLGHAYAHWEKRPGYVLLAGEGSLDYKNYLGTHESLVPCLRVATPYGWYASDNWLADVEGDDGVPEYSIGRIPASTAAAMSNAVEKIIAHESQAVRPAKALMVADDPDDGGNFWATADMSVAYLPPGYEVEKAYLQAKKANLAEVKAVVMHSINSGTSVMAYYGHSAWNRMAGEGILRNEDVASMTNAPHMPAALLMTCVPNRFEFPQYDYFGEEFMMLPGHGAIAVWGPTGESLNSLAQNYAAYFLDERRNDPGLRLGDLASRAAQRAADAGMARFMLDIMALLGDPMASAF